MIFGMPGTKLSRSPPITSTIGYGVCSFFASTPKATTKNNSNRKTISIAWISAGILTPWSQHISP